jgi:death-on-curing protein
MVAAIHDEAIYEFGGLAGIRDKGLLESAISRPRNRLVYGPRSTLFDLAASLCFGLTKDHAFIDGNKRTALLATGAFLRLNGCVLEPREDEEVLVMIDLADGRMDETTLAAWLDANSTRRARRR